MRVTEFVTTPNPNAMKCVTDATPGAGPRSFPDAASAAPDPLARALFAIPGVTALLIHDGWFTVSKAGDADWKTLKKQISAAVEQVG